MESVYLRWLKKPMVLRLVCLASSVVGVICYALSSTFNHLLGNWTWWKILLYIVFSFIICLAVFFSPKRSSTTSLRLEAHLAYLVLIVTSVSSFLFDNAAKGKPDAFSLISCAAFATMPLGLSNLTQLGFWVDLLYFFSGSLIVQLMKMNLWLVIVGGGFSYCLLQLQLRYHPHDTQDHNNLQLQVQNQVIIQIDDLERQISQQANAHDVDSTVGTSPEDGDLLRQSNSHPQDDGLIMQQHLMNCIKENQMLRKIIYPKNVQTPVTDGGLHLMITKEAILRLAYVFRINKLSHIGKKRHDLKFDHDWFRQKVEQNCNLYLRNKFLKLETNESAEADLTAELMKDKLHFEETCTLQSTWTVSHKPQREPIVKSIEPFL
ncbi:hypothetical protein PHAVU_008G257000 [Phaseolus vulgaris]|uniref:Exocyst subunit Exo70 family protein n=1 Tax=Phaseolus vulgaris TaxID=3885 RepID=V7BBD4_PHAVU|nr:hypothetical protein PHAVU_008G257000g [Phaseolus vulgaris]ESW14148.1 hypothetical protein PHAVU_008G257000g [Phaseolus vulgaris]